MDDTRPLPPAHALRATAVYAMGAVVALLMTVVIVPFAIGTWATVGDLAGEQALLTGLLAGVSALAGILSAYLATIWLLAATVLLLSARGLSRGFASRALRAALRLAAPGLARRVAATLVVATAASGLSLGTAQAGQVAPDVCTTEQASPHPARAAMTAPRIEDVPLPSPEVEPPPLGWEESTTPASEPAATQPPTSETAPAQPSSATPPEAPRYVVVERGDSLWSISDDLLGPGRDSDAEIAATWPRLYESNRDVVGDDPDRIDTGQRLVVPAGIGAGDGSAPTESSTSTDAQEES